jgi:hypothetical protein
MWVGGGLRGAEEVYRSRAAYWSRPTWAVSGPSSSFCILFFFRCFFLFFFGFRISSELQNDMTDEG